MPIKLKILGVEKLERMGIVISGTKQRLLYDLVNAAKRFGLEAVSIAKTKYLTGPRPEKIGVVGGRLRSSIATKTVQDGNIISTTIGSNLIYAAIHELGGITHPNLTDKMRKFAWAMFYQSKDEKWKGMALSKKQKLTINIKARPYIRPGMEEAMPSFEDNIARILGKISFAEGTA